MTKATLLKHLLTNGGYISIIGGKTSNFSKEELDNKRIFIVRDGKDSIPSNTRYTIFLRFTGHDTTTPIMNECRKKNIPFEFMNTGEMHRLINETFNEQRIVNPTNVITVPQALVKEKMTPKVRAPKGSIKDFIMGHADFNTQSIKDESIKLMGMLTENGIKSTVDSVQKTLSRIRLEMGIRARSTRKIKESTSTPAEKQTTNAKENALHIIKEIRAGLELLEEYIKSSDENNALADIKSIVERLYK